MRAKKNGQKNSITRDECGLYAFLLHSCAAGLVPDLTSEAAFSSVSEPRSWALNEDSWPILSADIYRFPGVAGRFTAREFGQVNAIMLLLPKQCGKLYDNTSPLCWDLGCKQAGKKKKKKKHWLKYKNWKTQTSCEALEAFFLLLGAVGGDQTRPRILPSICYTGLIPHRCRAHPVFDKFLRKRERTKEILHSPLKVW